MVIIMAEFFDRFLQFDLSVFSWMQTIQNPVLSAILKFVTTLGEGGIIFILLGIALLCTKKYRKIGVAVFAALIVMEIGNNLILKEIFARPRPFNLEAIDSIKYDFWAQVYKFPEIVHRPSSFSFPSGHTSSAFAAAIAVLFYNRKIGIPTTIFAAIMGFSRVYVEVHYCTDVLAGAIVGIIYALLGVLIAKFVFPIVDKILDKIFSKIFKNKKKTEAK